MEDDAFLGKTEKFFAALCKRGRVGAEQWKLMKEKR